VSTAYNQRTPGVPQAGTVAPADGSFRDPWPAFRENDSDTSPESPAASHGPPVTGNGFGLNFECLEQLRPAPVNALRELVRQYREEGIVARRHEIRRIRQARLFWQGLQYAWWNPNDMNWHLPFEQKFSGDRAVEEMPRYEFVTIFIRASGCRSSPCFCRMCRRCAFIRSRRSRSKVFPRCALARAHCAD
jgi:hypothetical protein